MEAYMSLTALSLAGHDSAVYSVAWSLDGTKIVSGSADNTVHVWEAKTGRQTAHLKGHTSSVFCVAVSPDDTMIASGSFDKSIRLWDAETGNSTAVLQP
jgi:WD40 repeat protein